ncbi:NUDIX hydrolase [Nonomuraea angiospora]|uniref:NUDIX hydrolase n=1 Tax=Nonomuraea angiospora TaxID=46172 RepID=UPI0033E20864
MNQSFGCAVTAHLLAADRFGRWLILRTSRDHSRWQLPGGRAHAGESPRLAAAREAREETGLDLPVGEMLIGAWVPGSPGRRDRMALLFATRTLTPADMDVITLQRREVDAWCMAPPSAESLPAHPLLAERLSVFCRRGPGQFIEQRPFRGQ